MSRLYGNNVVLLTQTNHYDKLPVLRRLAINLLPKSRYSYCDLTFSMGDIKTCPQRAVYS